MLIFASTDHRGSQIFFYHYTSGFIPSNGAFQKEEVFCYSDDVCCDTINSFPTEGFSEFRNRIIPWSI